MPLVKEAKNIYKAVVLIAIVALTISLFTNIITLITQRHEINRNKHAIDLINNQRITTCINGNITRASIKGVFVSLENQLLSNPDATPKQVSGIQKLFDTALSPKKIPGTKKIVDPFGKRVCVSDKQKEI